MISEAGPLNSSVRAARLFVLDTNVILHDARCIFSFEEHDVAIPITVLEELDRFKKGNGDIHAQARHFLRELDELSDDVLSAKGVSLGEGLGSFRVIIGLDTDRLRKTFLADTADHRILSTTLALSELEVDRNVVLVTKDTNLLMKAGAIGLTSQDYTTDKVKDFDNLYTGKRLISGVSSELVSAFYDARISVAEDVVDVITQPINNENFVIRNGSKSVLATYSQADHGFRRVTNGPCMGITPRNAEQAFALQALTNDDVKLVTLAGRAGCGKTLLTLASALDARNRYRQILLARPIVPLSNRDLGFIPGDVDAKLDPYMQPLYDNLTVLRHENPGLKEEMMADKRIEIVPLAYIRGRSLQRTFFIVDEAQNLTPHEVKTIITRAGEGTKIILTGDIQQIDHPYLDSMSNGLTYVINRMKGQGMYAHVTLERGVRSELAEVASTLL
ncbi:MAG: PhoH family protein [Planctomycetales bacterium]|jgi:PhoH-like ATPase